MNTQPVFTLLHLLLNTPDLHTTHHSRGNAADLPIQKHKPLHHKTVLKQPREGKGEESDGELWEWCKSRSQARPHVRACAQVSLHDSSYYIPGNHWGCLLYWVTTLGQQQFTEILCLGAASCGPLPSIVSVLTFPSIPPPVHRTLEDGAGVGVWRLFAGTVEVRGPSPALFWNEPAPWWRSVCLRCRCVSVRRADLLSGLVVHLPLHAHPRLPVFTQKTPAQR